MFRKRRRDEGGRREEEGWRREGGQKRLVLFLGDFLEVWVNFQFPMVIHCHSISGPGSRRGPGSSSFNEERQWGPETHRFLKTTGPVWKKLLLEEIKSLRDSQRGGYKRRDTEDMRTKKQELGDTKTQQKCSPQWWPLPLTHARTP